MSVVRVQVQGYVNGKPIATRIPRGQPGAGQFAYTGGAGSQAGFRDRNRRLAQSAQRHIVDELRGTLVRPAVSTGRLISVTAAEENITWSNTGFGVGDPSFLNDSRAKYWRTIDEGTEFWAKPFVGSFWYVIKGKAFGATINGLTAGPAFSAAGKASGGKLNPISRTRGEELFEEGDGKVGRVFIKKDIAPKHYYREGFRKSGVIEQGVESYWIGLREIWHRG